jgi:hypothetical protein
MKTRDMIIIAVVVMGLVVVYLMTRSPSTTDTAAPTTSAPTQVPKDPRANLSMMFFPASPDAKNYTNTQRVLNDWTFLSSLVKSITGKPAPMCIDMPATIQTDAVAMSNLETNVNYATKAALNTAATNNNFYDIAALYLGTLKVMAGAYPFTASPTYDSNGLLSTNYISDPTMGQWSIGLFKSFMQPIAVPPTAAALGNDSDVISFMNKMVPFYNSFVGSFSTMSASQLSNTVLDADTFAKLVSCMLVFQLTQKPVPTFVCTSSQK